MDEMGAVPAASECVSEQKSGARARFDREVGRLADEAITSILRVPEVRGVSIVVDWAIGGEDLPRGWFSTQRLTIESVTGMSRALPAFAENVARIWARYVDDMAKLSNNTGKEET